MLSKKRWFLTFILLLLAVTVAACSAPGAEPGAAQPDATPTDETVEQVAAEAAPAARLALADYLDIAPDALEMAQIEDAEWPNACLGLPEPGEMCASVLTPGYLITFTIDGESYAVRTDRSGDVVRIEAAATEAPAAEQAPVVAARQALADQLGVAPDAIEMLSVEAQEWSDSCLGLGGPAESCAAVITPGWQIMLGVEGEAYEVRTDETGQQVRIADEMATQPPAEAPTPDLQGAAVLHERSGGITGEVVTVRIFSDGTVERMVGRASSDTPVEAVTVEPSAVEALLADLQEAGYFELERSYLPADNCCDRYFYLTSVQQDGQVQTVEALEASPDTPEAVWQSIDLIEGFISEAFDGA